MIHPICKIPQRKNLLPALAICGESINGIWGELYSHSAYCTEEGERTIHMHFPTFACTYCTIHTLTHIQKASEKGGKLGIMSTKDLPIQIVHFGFSSRNWVWMMIHKLWHSFWPSFHPVHVMKKSFGISRKASKEKRFRNLLPVLQQGRNQDKHHWEKEKQ